VELLGFDADIEDLWKNSYCVASNYSQAQEKVIRSGNLGRALRASIAIPGALPPVLNDGELLCDGGTFNNFPVDVMRQMRGVGTVIGVDLHTRKPRRFEFDEIPGTWALLRDRLRPYSRRRYRFPSLVAYLMNVQILYSASRAPHARKLTDLYFNPPLERVGMLEWTKFDEIVRQGHAHAGVVLDGLAGTTLERIRARAA
jgi:NTE family protein